MSLWSGSLATVPQLLHPTHQLAQRYCIVLYFTVLYCTILYYTVLYCTILYYTVLYCTILYRWWSSWGTVASEPLHNGIYGPLPLLSIPFHSLFLLLLDPLSPSDLSDHPEILLLLNTGNTYIHTYYILQ